MDKKKKIRILIIIGIILLFLFTLIGTVLWVSSTKEKESKKVEEKKIIEYPETQTITCVKEKGNDDVKQTEIVYLEKGVLITRTNISEWSKPEPKDITCKYYTQQTEKMDMLIGVRSTVTCDESRGIATTVYTISEMDREETRLKQFDYLDNEDIFDYRNWVAYMEDSSYNCEAS